MYIYVCVWIDFNDLTWNDGQALHAKHLVIKIECGVGERGQAPKSVYKGMENEVGTPHRLRQVPDTFQGSCI